MDLLLMLVLVAVTSLAGGLLVFGDADRLGVAGTLLGGVLGFLTATFVERSRRRHADAHRFEQDRRVVYVRLLEAVADAEAIIRRRNVSASIRRERPRSNPEMPARPDMKSIDLLVAEVELLAPFGVYASAQLLAGALSLLDQGADAYDDEWDALSGDLSSARRGFLKRAKNDLGTPTGVMTRWQMRVHRVRKSLGLAKPKKKPAPSVPSVSEPPT